MNKDLKSYNLVFIGFMGVGKTTISSNISNILDREIIDIDKFIEKKSNMIIPDIFDKFGEKYFRDLESDVVLDISKEKGKIISCGGGTVIRESNVYALKENGIIIRLTADADTVLNRVKSSNNRPILNGNMNKNFISTLMKKRDLIYKNAADITVSTDDKSIEKISKECIEKSIRFIKYNK